MIQYYGNGAMQEFTTAPSSSGTRARDDRRRCGESLAGCLFRTSYSVQPATGSTPATVAAYDVATGNQLWSKPEPLQQADAHLDAGDAKLAQEARDTAGPTKVIPVGRYRPARLPRHLEGHTSPHQLPKPYDGKSVVSTGLDHRPAFDATDGVLLEDMLIQESDTQTAAFSPADDTLYTSAGDGALRSWDLD